MLKKFIYNQIGKIISTSILITLSLGLKPAISAEKIRVIFSPFDFDVAVESLEVYAETGEIRPDLAFYLNRVDERERTKVRELLQRRFKFDQVTISKVLRTSLGRDTLNELGEVVRVSLDTNGIYPLRGAIIQAAGNPEGFTIIDVLRNFPIENIYVSAESLLKLRQELKVSSSYRESIVEAIALLAAVEAEANPIDNVEQLTDLSQPGPYKYQETKIRVTKDAVRQTRQGLVGSYTFQTYLYLPENNPNPAPLIVISHGFGARQDNFTQLAAHLASHGYAVAIPEHVGSDLAYREELLKGQLSTAMSPIEYLDRPSDITYLLDELETNPTWQNRINLNQVGVIGESLGATTVLSLAGAEINPSRLKEECGADEVNLSAGLILQCQGVALPPVQFNLKDERVKAVISAHPLTSAIFGPEGMETVDIPTMIVGGSNDFITPVATEQIHPFIWLKTPEKYLVMFEPGTHFTSSEPPKDNPVDYVPGAFIGENRQIAFEYFRGLSVAFMNVYLREESDDQVYLSAAYGEANSKPDLNIYQIQALTPSELEIAYGTKPPTPIIPDRIAPQPPIRERGIIAEIQETGVIKMGMRRDATPFGYLNQDDNWTGYCDELAETFAEYLQTKLDLASTPKVVKLQSTLANRFQLIEDETVHFECGPNTIRRDLEKVSFSIPFFITGIQFLVPEENITKVNPSRDLSGVRVGVLRETTNELLINQQYPNAQIVYFDGEEGRNNAINALVGAEIDTFLDDTILLSAEIDARNLDVNDYQFVPKLPLDCSYYGLALPKNDPEWNKLVNEFLSSDAADDLQVQSFPEIADTDQKDSLNYCLNLKKDF